MLHRFPFLRKNIPSLDPSHTIHIFLVLCLCLFFYLDFSGEVIPQLRIEQLGTLCTSHASDVFTVYSVPHSPEHLVQAAFKEGGRV